MLGDADDNNPTRIEAPSIEDGPAAFSFKSLDLKSSRYIAEEMKVSSHLKLFIYGTSPCTDFLKGNYSHHVGFMLAIKFTLIMY